MPPDDTTSGASAEGRVDRPASETAMGVARLRALHQLRDAEPRILDDPVVVRLLDDTTIQRIREYDLENEPGLVTALRAHVVSRSRFTEDLLHDAVSRGVRQYVLLGAGLDTFAYRQPTWARGLSIFEVDHPASQATKLRLLESRGVAVPSNLRHVDADFEQTGSIAAALRGAGFDPHALSFVSCLGVFVYLAQSAIERVFAFVEGLPRGSEFVFTISAPRSQLDAASQSAREALEAAVAAMGEPWLTHLSFDAARAQLTALGFASVTQPSVGALEERYFRGRADALGPPRRSSLVVAVR